MFYENVVPALFPKIVAVGLGAIFAVHVIVLATAHASPDQSVASQGLQILSVLLVFLSATHAAVKSQGFGRRFWGYSAAGFALLMVSLLFRHFDPVKPEGIHWSDFVFLLHMVPFGLALLLRESPREKGSTHWPTILDYLQVVLVVAVLFVTLIFIPSRSASDEYIIHSLYPIFAGVLIARNVSITTGFWFRTRVAHCERERLAFGWMAIYLTIYTLSSALTHFIFHRGLPPGPAWIQLQGSVPFLVAAWLFYRWKDLPASSQGEILGFRDTLSLHLIPASLPFMIAALANWLAGAEPRLARWAITGSLTLFALRFLATLSSEYSAQKAAHQGEHRFRSLVLATAQIVWSANARGEFVGSQFSWASFSGMLDSEIRGWGWIQALHPDDREQTKAEWSRATENGIQCYMECRLRRHDGEYRHMAVRGVPVICSGTNIREWVGTCADITERKQAEESLRRSEERYRSVVAAMSEGVVVQRVDGTIIASNASGERILGMPVGEIIGQPSVNSEQFTIDEDGSPYPSETHPSMVALRTGKRASNVRMGIRRSDGSLTWLLINAEPIYQHGDKTPYAVVTTFTDDTKRREAEQQVQKGALYTRSLIEASPDPLVTISPEGKITDLNMATETVIGLSRERLIGTDFCDYFTEPEHARDIYQQVFEKGSVRNYPLAIRDVLGRITHVLYSATAFKDQTGEVAGVFAAARDISERKILEQQLLQVQKLEAVGRLAAGVAHDFNNLLGVILGNAEFLLAGLRADKDRRQCAEDIICASKQGADLTQRLLTFSRNRPFTPVVQDLNLIVQKVGQLLPRIIGEDIEIAIILSHEQAPVLADPAQIEQILLNLAVNSRDAMPLGGKLRIETGNCEKEEGGESIGIAAGRFVTLTISDTGVGMSQQIMSHAFDPFFTTKDVGKGTGLGLSTVYGIVKESGGSVLVDSEPGEGATFRIYLPRAKEELLEPTVSKSVPDEFALGSGTILLVEDRNDLRDLTRKFLQKLGYRVLDTGLPEDAVRIARQFTGRIDLLLTDFVMPGMNGRELAKRLRSLYVDIHVLYVSGFNDPTLKREIAEDNDLLMQKPFHLRELALTIRELLRASRSAPFLDTKNTRAS